MISNNNMAVDTNSQVTHSPPTSYPQNLSLSVSITRLISDIGPVTKQHKLVNGKLETDSKPAPVTSAVVHTFEAKLENLAEFHASLQPTHAAAHGVPSKSRKEVKIIRTDERKPDDPADVIARSSKPHDWGDRDFTWGDSLGVLFFDHDPGGARLDPEMLYNILVEAEPALAGQRFLVQPSSSSCIEATDGSFQKGLDGFHMYTFMQASKIPAFTKLLQEKLEAIGQVRYVVSEGASLLPRYPIDMTVFQANRVDYAAPPVVGEGLALFGRGATYIGGTREVFDVDTAAPLTEEQIKKARVNKKKARDLKEPEAKALRETLIDKGATKLQETNPGMPRIQALGQMRALHERRELRAHMEVFVIEGGRHVPYTVAHICENANAFVGKHTLDPLEPDYQRFKDIGQIFKSANGGLYILSFAHGKRTYDLKTKGTVNFSYEQFGESVSEAVRLLAQTGRFYVQSGAIGVVEDGKWSAISRASLEQEAEKYLDCTKQVEGKGRGATFIGTPFPEKAAQRIMENAELLRQFPQVIGTRNQPILTVGGRLIAKPGFDAETGLLFSENTPSLAFNAPITPEQVRTAFETMFRPWSAYAWETPESKSIAVMAILTAIVRPLLPTALATIFVGAQQGVGKTKAAEAVGAVGGGYKVINLKANEEGDKRLDSVLMSGVNGIVIDNVKNGAALDRESLAMMITSGKVSIRKFGTQQMLEVPTRVGVLVSGNNPDIGVDMNRRFLRAVIRTTSATPSSQQYSFDPQTEATRNRDDIVAAGLMILKYAQQEGMTPQKLIGSFEDWSRFVGSGLVALLACGVEGLSTFEQVFEQQISSDPMSGALAALTEVIEWGQALGVKGVGLGQITVPALRDAVTDQFGRRSAERDMDEFSQALSEVLETFAEACNFQLWNGNTMNGIHFGRWLKRCANRHFPRVDAEGNRSSWMVENCGSERRPYVRIRKV